MDSYREHANLLKLMAHPERLRILSALTANAECVCHLAALLEKPQPYVSQQLAVMRHAGLIEDQKEGNNVYYRLTDPRAAGILAVADVQPRAGREVPEGCPCPKCRVDHGNVVFDKGEEDAG